MYLPNIVKTGTLIAMVFWGFLIENHQSDSYQVPQTMTHHLGKLAKNKAMQKQIKDEFHLSQITIGKDTISFSRKSWWDNKRKTIEPLVDMEMWKRYS